jgi:hypothetical protein
MAVSIIKVKLASLEKRSDRRKSGWLAKSRLYPLTGRPTSMRVIALSAKSH